MGQIDAATQTYQNNGQTIDAHTGLPPVSSTPAAPVAPTTPTIGSLYGGISSSDQGLNDSTNYYKGIANTPVDEAGIRSSVMSNLQAEIDATNSVYAQKLAEAQRQGAGLIGSTSAIDARRGVSGSDFGTADQYNTASKNQATYAGIDAERQAAIGAITDKGNAEATAEINQKQNAQKSGADSYINFLTAANTRQGTRTTNAAQAALSSGIDLTSAPTATIKAIADSYQIDPAALVSSYVSSKNALAETQATLTKPIASAAGSTETQYNPTTGKYDTTQGTPTDANLKEYQYAVANNNFTGSLADWNAQKANQKVSDSVTHDPLTGALQVVQRAGPKVAGTGGTKLPAASTGGSTALPSSSAKQPVSPATPTVPVKGPVTNPLDKLSGSDLILASTGNRSQAGIKSYPGQVDAAVARIRAVMPDWNPANAAAQYTFFKSPTTQTFIANSNTVLNTLDQIKALSAKVPRGSVQILNGGQLALSAGVSDANAAKLVQLSTIAGDEAGKLLGGSAGSDFTTALGISLVNPKYNDATFGATIDQLGGRVRNKVSEYFTQGGQTNPNAGASGGTDLTSLRSKYNY